jgi:hypothetical protein
LALRTINFNQITKRQHRHDSEEESDVTISELSLRPASSLGIGGLAGFEIAFLLRGK